VPRWNVTSVHESPDGRATAAQSFSAGKSCVIESCGKGTASSRATKSQQRRGLQSLRDPRLTRRLAARRGAGGIVSGDITRLQDSVPLQQRGFDQKIKTREQAGSGLRPLRGSGAAAAMIRTAVTVISGLKRGLGWFGDRRPHLRHPVMAWHRRLLGARGQRFAHAVHRRRLGGTRHRHRPECRDEHDQQQKSCSPAKSPPHLPDSIAEISSQFPVLSGSSLAEN